VCHGLLRSPALSVYICEECEALWQSPFTIGLVGAFEDFNTLMQRTGRPGGWSEVEIVRHIEHRARITWSAERTAEGLLPVQTFTVPAWFSDSKDGAWSLICTFAIAPNEQGNLSEALVSFLVSEAPHRRLVPGAVLHLFEGFAAMSAKVEIID
jgi:hypothetical protein